MRSMKGQSTKVVYEDFRLDPKGELAAELQVPLVKDLFHHTRTLLNSQSEPSSVVATEPQLAPVTTAEGSALGKSS